MHCGMDGWGRPYDYVAVIASFGSDVIVLEESWTVEGEERGQAEQVAAASRLPDRGAHARRRDAGCGHRRTRTRRGSNSRRGRSTTGRSSWTAMRPQPDKVQALTRWQEAEPGRWGIAVLVRPDLADSGLAGAPDERVARGRRAPGRGGGGPRRWRDIPMSVAGRTCRTSTTGRTATGPSCATACAPAPAPTRCCSGT